MSIRNSSILIFKRLIYVPVLCTSFSGGLPAASGAVYSYVNTQKYIKQENINRQSAGWVAVCRLFSLPAGNYKVEFTMNTFVNTNIQNVTTSETITFYDNTGTNKISYLNISQTSDIQIAVNLSANIDYKFILELTRA